MTIHLDHTIVPSRNRVAAARQLAEILDVPWVPTALGHFAAVYVNDGLTIDFIDTDEVFPIYHLCFCVDDATFDAILARLRAAGIAWRSTVRGPIDRDVDTSFGGRGLYWNEPDGHQWEMLTVSYARLSGADTDPAPGSG